MTDDEILHQITIIFRQIFDNETLTLTPQTTAQDIAEWDSFNHINILVAVECHFGIKFNIAEVENVKNIGDMMELIQKKLSQKTS